MKLITPHTTRTQLFARPANQELHHPEGYWSLETEGGDYLSSLDEMPIGKLDCHKNARFNWESHTGITGGKMLVKSAQVLRDDEQEGPILVVDGYLINARMATPHQLHYPPNFATSNVWGVHTEWEDLLYAGSCTPKHEPVTQDLLDHIQEILKNPTKMDALKTSFGR